MVGGAVSASLVEPGHATAQRETDFLDRSVEVRLEQLVVLLAAAGVLAVIAAAVGAQKIQDVDRDPVGEEWQRGSVLLSAGEATLAIRRVAE